MNQAHTRMAALVALLAAAPLTGALAQTRPIRRSGPEPAPQTAPAI